MRSRVGLLLFLLLLQACALAQPTTSMDHSPVPSAAQPAVEGPGDPVRARRGLESLRQHLQRGGALSEQVGEGVYRCLTAEGGEQLICAYGSSADQPIALAIFWPENLRDWRWQFYPRGPSDRETERRSLFVPKGCSFGCFSQVRQVRAGEGDRGPELLVVVDLGAQATSPMEEVHLLRLVGDAWEVAWLPGRGDWNWGHARVTLPESGLTQFRVRSSSWWREDRFAGYLSEPEEGEHRWFAERWVRKGSGFVLRDQTEEPSGYGTLVRLIHYLSTADDQRAAAMLTPGLSLEAARQTLAQRPPRQGWSLKRLSPLVYEIDRDGDGRHELTVHLHEGTEGYRVSRIEAP